MKTFFISCLIGLLLCGCSEEQKISDSLINTTHLDQLYESITFDGRSAAIIHIYADAPDYHRTEAPGEGIACIDDVARAAVFYLRHFHYSKTQESEVKARRLLNFILSMQAENGFFYNFVDSEYRIEKSIHNSKPRGDWWSWRAMWALAEALPVYKKMDSHFAESLKASLWKASTSAEILESHYQQTEKIEGLEVPAWLPGRCASDQAAVLIMALSLYYPFHKDARILKLIQQQADGIMRMQKGNPNMFPFGVFLSWKNLWHAYGNSQADALLKAYLLTSSKEYEKSALLEIDVFYPYLQQDGYYNWFRVESEGDSISMIERKKFEQIAYGIRPMVFACLSAYASTKDTKYAQMAGDIACWFLGKNIAGEAMYNPDNGRCYDEIDSRTEINLNSGAESTIEALLSILEIENNPMSKSIFHKYYQKTKEH